MKSRPARKPAKVRASTSQILGRENGHPQRVPAKWLKPYRRLLALREHFQNEKAVLSESAREPSPSFSEHMADAGTDAYDRDWALGMLSSEQDALFQIEQALDRIRNGTYGICELTGKKISAARLEAVPWTRFSAQSERQLEREGKADRTRLGAVTRLPRHETLNEVGEEQR